MMIYDADNQILGRIASVIAKQLLKGENVIVVNSEKALVSGNPKNKQKFYYERIKRGDPIHGPFFPKNPDAIFKRAVRGMLPWDRPRGREAYKNLKVFVGIPEKYKNEKMERIKVADASKLKCKTIILKDLSKNLGGR